LYKIVIGDIKEIEDIIIDDNIKEFNFNKGYKWIKIAYKINIIIEINVIIIDIA
jgi:hypothetical protein